MWWVSSDHLKRTSAGRPEWNWTSPELGGTCWPWDSRWVTPGKVPSSCCPSSCLQLTTVGCHGPSQCLVTNLLHRRRCRGTPRIFLHGLIPVAYEWASPMGWHSYNLGWAPFCYKSCYLNVPETSSTDLVFQLAAWPKNRGLSRTRLKIEL